MKREGERMFRRNNSAIVTGEPFGNVERNRKQCSLHFREHLFAANSKSEEG
jgi:hypothetical protein